MEIGEDEYVPLYRAIQIGDWKKAQEFFNDDKDALIDKLNIEGSTTLHIAIGNPQNTWFLGKLLDLIDPESLPTLVNSSQENALHHAAILGNTIAAKKLVDKNPLLLFAVDNKKYLPIHRAIFESHKTTVLYLLQMCKQHIGLSQKDGYHNPFQGANGAMLLGDSILSRFLDVAYDLLMDYPELATTNVATVKPALLCIAESGMRIRVPNDITSTKDLFILVTHDKHLHNTRVDKEGNNLLHLAGELAPTDKLNMVKGAALQMQRELQWFQSRCIIFSVSDAISLFTSTTSLLMFLSILTSRYAEEDFLNKLPLRLILGLVMLLMSVATMMIAFNATLYILFGQEKSWILIPTAAITCLPVASFMRMQLPLLFDLISSTYGNGIFGK
ncbi:hypothetical protein L1987_01171 [Smallanthus sonchifolius]|uniref:Uncharacterized protein n=1 Tax=Smallanthus sonchifolius TaxID=185202 RepID=A0ACB9K4C1_9ASTR|nr:hypothetical protein L1987_01171 [Smallanthus sonchifolius]